MTRDTALVGTRVLCPRTRQTGRIIETGRGYSVRVMLTPTRESLDAMQVQTFDIAELERLT